MRIQHRITGLVQIPAPLSGFALAVCVCGVFFVLSACSRQKVAAGQAAGQAPGPAAASAGQTGPAVQQALPPEYAKLARVLGDMSPRAKDAIPNGDPAAFLADLQAVLSEDEAFVRAVTGGASAPAASAGGGPVPGESLLYLCDKGHYLPQGYQPPGLVRLEANDAYNVNRSNLYLRADVEPALREMGRAARADGITLLASSTYRSYDYQITVYNRLVAIDGQEQADRESARPGTSQHQLGTVVDFGAIDPSWEPTAACQWLLRHAGEYGWSLSFPDGYEDMTGYEYECWHFRYIGKTACAFQKKWFGDVQQFMLEFIDAWRRTD